MCSSLPHHPLEPDLQNVTEVIGGFVQVLSLTLDDSKGNEQGVVRGKVVRPNHLREKRTEIDDTPGHIRVHTVVSTHTTTHTHKHAGTKCAQTTTAKCIFNLVRT